MNRDRVATLAGFAGAILILGVIVWAIGIDDVIAAMSRADPHMLAFVVIAAAIWQSAWGLSLWTVLRTIGAPVSARRAIFVFTAAMFSNNVTPFGQAGGEPVSALLISTAADTDYQTGLAAIASVDTLHFVPSIGIATVGFGYLLLSAVELTRNLVFAAVAAGALALVVPLVAYLAWRNRDRIEAAVVRAIAPVAGVIGRVVPSLSAPDPADIEHRIESFFATIERVAGDRRAMVTAMTFSAVGWLSLAGALWLSLFAMGYGDVSFAAILFVVPVGAIAGVTPLPGGLGGLDAALIVLLSATTGLAAPIATAAVLIHRGVTYWLTTLFGGGAAAVVGSWRRR